MQKPVTAGFDGQVHFRAPSDFMAYVHLAARKQGMTAASFMRWAITREVERAGCRKPLRAKPPKIDSPLFSTPSQTD